MKRLLLLTMLFTITSASFSQINKRQWFSGGNASFSSGKNEIWSENWIASTNKSTTLQLSPNVGYFIADKLAVGARVNLKTVENKVRDLEGGYDFSSTEVSLSPFFRYYFLPRAEKLNLFADAGYSYGNRKYTYSSAYSNSEPSTRKATTNGYYISAGPAIFLTPNTALELTLGYNYSKQKDFDNSDRNFMVGVGFQIHLGK